MTETIRLVVVVLSLILCSSVPFAEDRMQAQDHNGIAVGRAKLFDNRTLVLMLQQLEETLRTTQTLNPSGLVTATGQLQGSRTTEMARSLQLTGFPTSAEEATAKDTTAGSGETSVERTEKTTAAAVTPAAPAVPAQLAGGGEQKFGIAAQDLLNEQINLTYQVFNLRMLLERAMSDRLHTERTGDTPRLQAVLGFEISIDPQKRFKNAAAVVEVTVCVKGAPGCGREDPSARDISVVSLMPREKTYNMAVLDRRANAFGGAVPVKILTVGYSEQRRSETFFLYQDSDTFAFHRQPKSNRADVTFGWQFRPVFDRKAVDPGLRQVFAVLALPSGVDDASEVVVAVKTYWTKYRGGKEGVTEQRVLADAADTDDYTIALRHSDSMLESLGPRIDDLGWSRVGADKVLLDVTGRNFYAGTSALIGATVVDTAPEGFVAKSDQRIQVLAPFKDLLTSSVMLLGRYGPTREVVHPKVAADDGRPGWGLHIGQVSWRPPAPERTTATVRIELWPKCRPGHGRGPVPPDFRGQPLVVSIGDDFITTDFDPPMMSTRTVEDLDADCQPKPTIAEVGTATIQVEVPTAILDGERLVRVRVPFASRDFDDRRVIYPSFRIDRVVRVSDSPTVLDIVGAGFVKDAITVHADRPYRTEADGLLHVGTTVMRLTTKGSPLTAKQLIVCCKLGDEPVAVEIPSGKAEAKEPKFTTTTASVKHESVVSVDFQGENLGGVSAVTFEDKLLASEVSKDGMKLTVRLTRDVTKSAGVSVELLAKAEGGKTLQALTIQVAAK